MPTSHGHQLNEIVEILQLLQPRTLLDVGVGLGKYGVLAREFLDGRQGRWQKADWQVQIDGIEGFPDYITPLQTAVYNTLHIGEARQLLPTLPTHYDLILLIDVLEHFPKEEGRALLTDLLKAGRNLVVSTPRWFIPQTAVYGNAYETHHTLWHKKELAGFAPLCFIPNDISLLCVIGPDSTAVHRQIYALRRQLKRYFPWLVTFYRQIKS